MVGVVCKDHVKQIEGRLAGLQAIGEVPNGVIQLEPLRILCTNCIRGNSDDYMEIESKRTRNIVHK